MFFKSRQQPARQETQYQFAIRLFKGGRFEWVNCVSTTHPYELMIDKRDEPFELHEPYTSQLSLRVSVVSMDEVLEHDPSMIVKYNEHEYAKGMVASQAVKPTDNLLEIKLSSMNAVPDVVYNGESLSNKGIVDISYQWATRSSDYQGVQDISIKYFDPNDPLTIKQVGCKRHD